MRIKRARHVLIVTMGVSRRKWIWFTAMCLLNAIQPTTIIAKETLDEVALWANGPRVGTAGEIDKAYE